MVRFAFLSLVLSFSLSSLASTDKLPNHFAAKASANLPEALANLTEYNAQLQLLLNKPKLEPIDLAQIHQLTYTLEAALQRIEEEVEQLQEDLEEVHLGSEQLDRERVKPNAIRYLERATALHQPQ